MEDLADITAHAPRPADLVGEGSCTLNIEDGALRIDTDRGPLIVSLHDLAASLKLTWHEGDDTRPADVELRFSMIVQRVAREEQS